MCEGGWNLPAPGTAGGSRGGDSREKHGWQVTGDVVGRVRIWDLILSEAEKPLEQGTSPHLQGVPLGCHGDLWVVAVGVDAGRLGSRSKGHGDTGGEKCPTLGASGLFPLDPRTESWWLLTRSESSDYSLRDEERLVGLGVVWGHIRPEEGVSRQARPPDSLRGARGQTRTVNRA